MLGFTYLSAANTNMWIQILAVQDDRIRIRNRTETSKTFLLVFIEVMLDYYLREAA